MSKKNIERFYTHVKQEGDAGATRGKVSVAMCTALGAGNDDVIEFEVNGGVIVGGHVLSKSEKREYLREQGASKRSAPVKKKVGKVKKSKPVVKSSEDEAPRKKGKSKGKKLAKPSKRKTKVSFESEPRPKKKGKVKLKKKLRRHSS